MNVTVVADDGDDKRREEHHQTVSEALRRAREKNYPYRKSTEPPPVGHVIPPELEHELETLIHGVQQQQEEQPPSSSEEEEDEEVENEDSQIPVKKSADHMAELRKREQSIDAMIQQMEVEFGQSPPVAVHQSLDEESHGSQQQTEEEDEEDEGDEDAEVEGSEERSDERSDDRGGSEESKTY